MFCLRFGGNCFFFYFVVTQWFIMILIVLPMLCYWYMNPCDIVMLYVTVHWRLISKSQSQKHSSIDMCYYAYSSGNFNKRIFTVFSARLENGPWHVMMCEGLLRMLEQHIAIIGISVVCMLWSLIMWKFIFNHHLTRTLTELNNFWLVGTRKK